MTTTKSMVFGGGIPTEPDVIKLKKELGIPEIGTVIPYGKVGEIIGCEHDSFRYKSVTMAWRKSLFRDNNVLIGVEKTKGFVALDPHARICHASTRYKHALKSVRRSGVIAQTTAPEGLTDGETRARDHLIAAGAAIALAAAQQARALKEPPRPGMPAK